MAYTREQEVKLALSYNGVKGGSARHHKLVNTFNSVHPHGEHMTYSRAWCACTVTAWLIMGGYTTKNMPMSCSCKQLIRDTQALEKKGLAKWVEDDAWRGAQPGDLIIYYWKAPKRGDCKKYTSHVGMIYKVTSKGYEVIEGNKHNKVAKRSVPFNWQYIRGFCHLHYNGKPDPKPQPVGKLVVDGVFGKQSIKRAQEYFRTEADGTISGQKRLEAKHYKGIDQSRVRFGKGGSQLVRAIQKMVKVSETGVLDVKTIKALQKFFGIVEDGNWGKATSKAFQRFLNSKLK